MLDYEQLSNAIQLIFQLRNFTNPKIITIGNLLFNYHMHFYTAPNPSKVRLK